MDLEKKLQQLKARYNEVNAAMSDPAVFDDPENYTKLTKERSDLEEVVKDFDRYSELKGNLEGNLELIEINEDPEITEMDVVENKEIKTELGRLEEELKIKLVPKDPEDSKNAIVEVRAGTGGDEAAIFAGDLFDMYRRYSDDLGWKLQILSLNESVFQCIRLVFFESNAALRMFSDSSSCSTESQSSNTITLSLSAYLNSLQ